MSVLLVLLCLQVDCLVVAVVLALAFLFQFFDVIFQVLHAALVGTGGENVFDFGVIHDGEEIFEVLLVALAKAKGCY